MTASTINFQPHLQNNLVTATPLKASDFEVLYAAALDPLIWEQHPNKTATNAQHLKIILKVR
jgi:hypothetical protein